MDEADGPTARLLLATTAGDVLAGLVRARCGLSLVDHLARLHLEARRVGLPIRVEVPSAAAREVLELAGLADLVGRDQPSSTSGRPKSGKASVSRKLWKPQMRPSPTSITWTAQGSHRPGPAGW